MNPYLDYSKPATASLTRVEVLIGLYDGAISSVESACAALRADPTAKVFTQLSKAQQFLVGLSGGLDLSQPEATVNFLRLFEFASRCVESRELEKLEAAARVLKTMREGFQEIRADAIVWERSGQIPGIGAGPLVQATA